MLGQTSLLDEETSLPLQVETGPAALSLHVASLRSTRALWTALGFAALLLVGVSACAFHAFASERSSLTLALFHASREPEVAFNPGPVLGPRGIRPVRHPGSDDARPTALRPAVAAGAHSASLPVVRQPLEWQPANLEVDVNIPVHRATFTAGLMAMAAGLIAGPAQASAVDVAKKPTGGVANKPPTFIDVEVDLGLGKGYVLDIRQAYGMPKPKSGAGQAGGDRQGTYIWPASTDLAKFLTSESGRKLVKGRRVVELGAGTAISGLAAGLSGAEEVVFTDGSEEVLEVTTDNLHRNKPQIRLLTRSRIAQSETNFMNRMSRPSSAFSDAELVQQMRWGNEDDLSALLASHAGKNGFDLVLGAEITYLSASIDPLLTTVHALLSSSALAKSTVEGDIPDDGYDYEMLKINSQAKFRNVPVALLTFTPELTAFDGGGVSELENKARKRGLRVHYFAPPRNNPDPDTRLMALTLNPTAKV